MMTPLPVRSCPSVRLLRALASAFTLIPTAAFAASRRCWYSSAAALGETVGAAAGAAAMSEAEPVAMARTNAQESCRRSRFMIPPWANPRGLDDEMLAPSPQPHEARHGFAH